MLRDRVLVWRFNRGSKDALSSIYKQYRADLLSLATSLLNDVNGAEDVVHDVFVTFTQSAGKFRLSGSLRGYLATCVANHARNLSRKKHRHRAIGLDAAELTASDSSSPDYELVHQEEARKMHGYLLQLPQEQREVVIMHLQYGVRFREIAESENISIHTIKSRYKYGLDKLHSILNGEVEK